MIAPVSQEKTRVINEDEINKIKKETTNIYLGEDEIGSYPKKRKEEYEEEDDEDYDDAYDDDEDEINPKMDKAITIMGIVAGVIIVGLIIFILVSFFGDFKFGKSNNKGNTEISQDADTNGINVPNLKGYTLEEAQSALNALGLGIQNAGTTSSDTYPKGQIVSQTPDDGSTVEAHTTIEVIISSGQGEVAISSVVGMDETTAYNTLSNAGFVPVKEYAYDNTVEQGIVISQSPDGGALGKEGDSVKIVISRGPESAAGTTGISVPKITGQTEEAARAALTAAGLTAGSVTSAYSDTVPEGQIISQSPAEGSAAEEGAAVDFIISSGTKDGNSAEGTTYKMGVTIKRPDNASVAAANIYLYDGADGTGNLLEQWTNQSIDLFGTDGLNISKSGLTVSSGSLKIEWLDSAGNVIGNPQIVSSFNFKEE